MAYDPNKEKNTDKADPYSQTLGSYGGTGSREGVAPSFKATASSSAALPGGDAGPTGSGHVNFDQIYNANAGTSAREANKIRMNASQQGNQARTGIAGATSQFNEAARTGSYSPTSQQAAWAKYSKNGPTGVERPKEIVAASNGDASTGQQRSYTERQQGLDAGGYWGDDGKWVSTVAVKNDAGETVIPAAEGASPPPEDFRAQLEAGAAQKYSGPNSLTNLDLYDQLLRDTGTAEDTADALGAGNAGLQGMGLNQLDAALVGASGRRGFDELAREYGGLRGELDAANTSAIGVADAARAQTDTAASEYQKLLDGFSGESDFDARVAADKAEADAINKRSNNVIAALSPKLGSRNTGGELGLMPRNFVGYPEGLNAPDEFSQLYRDFGLKASKSDGQVDNPDDWALLEGLEMTEADAEALARMSAAERRAWFEQRKKEKGL
jgi:hypothetical protein